MGTREEQVHARALALLHADERTARPPLVQAPATLRDALVRPSWPAVAGLLVVVLVAAGVLVARVLLAGAQAQPVAVRPASAHSTASAPSGPAPSGSVASGPATGLVPAPTASAGPTSVVVDVAGAVARPAVLRLPSGSRVVDALERAGGTTPDADLTGVNRARPLVDGELLRVPRRGEVIAAPAPAQPGTAPGATGAPGASGSGAAAVGAPVDLNSADAAALDTLPGIGPALATRILAWRTEHGRFTTVDELGEVSGIGDTLLSRLRPLVRVGG